MNAPRDNGRAAAAPATTEERAAEPGLLDQVVAATAQARQFTLEDVRYMAVAASKSGMFGMTEAQAFVLMMLAEAKGLHPIEAVQRYHVIHNKPTMRADVMLAEMIARGWVVDWISDDDDANEQAAMWSHPRRQPTAKRVGFTKAQAERAELKSDLWKKYPSNMLRARAISNAVRKFDPGLTVGIYTPEEVSDFDERPAPIPPNSTFRGADSYNLNKPPFGQTAEPVEKTESATPPAPARAGEWVQTRVDEVNADWAAFMFKEGKPHEPLVKHVNEAVNGVITTWLENGLIQLDQVKGSKKDTRSTAKMWRVVDAAWDDDERATRDEFQWYFDSKWEREAAALGINLDAEPAPAVTEP